MGLGHGDGGLGNGNGELGNGDGGLGNRDGGLRLREWVSREGLELRRGWLGGMRYRMRL